MAQEQAPNEIEQVNNASEKLVVVWTSGDAEVAKKMVYMYTYNAKKYGWWKNVTFIIWGPSSKLLSEDTELQDYLKKMKEEGIVLEACKACADMYGVADKLTQLGVDVKYMGTALTDYIKGEEHVITF
ncbi:MAG: DsrE family protein [Marinilabiliales bacterium]|nr:MAG: DsrE family protein [Marinilabiliales bacterium]